MSPHLTLFLRHCGDFIGYLFGGEFDVVHEGLLGFVAADVHHLEHRVFVGEVHIGDSCSSGGIRSYTSITRNNNVAVEVGLSFLAFFFQCLLLLHSQSGRHFLSKGRHNFRQIFENVLDVAVQHLLVDFRHIVAVFLADGY